MIMPAPGVETQIQLQVDFLAAYVLAIRQSVSRRRSLWKLIHDANDPLYENRVLGRTITTLDVDLGRPPLGTLFATWVGGHGDYFRHDLGLAGGWDDYLEACRWRVAEDVARLLVEGGSAPLHAKYVYPSADCDLGGLERSKDSFRPGPPRFGRVSAGVPATVLASGPGQVAAVVPEGVKIGAEDFTVAATLATAGGQRVTVAATLKAGVEAGTVVVLGREPLAEDSVASQDPGTGATRTMLAVAKTGAFVPGLAVLIADDDGDEWGVISSLQPDQTITVVAPLRHEFRRDRNATVTPLFDTVVAATCNGSGSEGDRAAFRFVPDRSATLA
jgi:hypothetical protein